MVPGDRFGNLLELKHRGWSVFGTDDGFHVLILPSLKTLVLSRSYSFSGSEAMADGLKPLKMSQPSRTTSLKKMGRISTVKKGERGFSPNITRKAAASERVAAITPHPESQRGMSRD